MKLYAPEGQIPAYCAACGTMFFTIGPIGGDLSHVSIGRLELRDNFARCPNCGSKAKLLEGIFTFNKGFIEFLSGPQWTVDALQSLYSLLQVGIAEKQNPEQLARSLSAQFPALSSALMDKQSTGNWIMLITFLWMVLTYLFGGADGGITSTHLLSDSELTGDITIAPNIVVGPLFASDASPTAVRAPSPAGQNAGEKSSDGGVRKVAKNAKCPCGSGKKYRKCHGQRVGSGAATPTPSPGNRR